MAASFRRACGRGNRLTGGSGQNRVRPWPIAAVLSIRQPTARIGPFCQTARDAAMTDPAITDLSMRMPPPPPLPPSSSRACGWAWHRLDRRDLRAPPCAARQGRGLCAALRRDIEGDGGTRDPLGLKVGSWTISAGSTRTIDGADEVDPGSEPDQGAAAPRICAKRSWATASDRWW